MVYNKPGNQTEHTDTVIDADFRLRLWRYQYPTVLFVIYLPVSSFIDFELAVSDCVLHLHPFFLSLFLPRLYYVHLRRLVIGKYTHIGRALLFLPLLTELQSFILTT